MKIEMPREPAVERLWTRDPEDASIIEWHRDVHGSWFYAENANARLPFDKLLRTYRAVYTEHPDLDALECLPTPWEVRNGGTIVDANGKVIMEATVRCTSGRNRLVGSAVNRLIVRLVNEFAARNPTSVGEDGKR